MLLHKRFARLLSFLAFLLLAPAAQAATYPQGWTNLSTVNGTSQIFQNRSGSICPTDPSVEPAGCHAGAPVDAWNSGAVRSADGRLYFTGGGHSDYEGNELYYVDPVASPPIVNRYNNPVLPGSWNGSNSPFLPGPGWQAGGPSVCSSGSGTAAPGQTTTGCTPAPRHTYSGVGYIPPGEPNAADSLVLWNGCEGGPNNCGFSNFDLWTFSFSNNTWKYVANLSSAFGQGGTNGGNDFADAVAYNTADHRLYIWDATNNAMFGYVDPSNWTYHSIAGISSPYSNYGGYASGAIDPVRGYMIVETSIYAGGSNLLRVNLSNGAVTDVTSSCSGAVATAAGVVWDSALQTIVIWPNSGASTYDFNPTTNACVKNTWSGASPQSSSIVSGGTFGRFAYIPSQNIYTLLAGGDTDPMVLCRSASGCGGSAPPPPPPPPPSACDVTGDGLVNVADVQKEVNMDLQIIPCTNPSGTCNVSSVQKVVNAALGGPCVSP